MQRGVLSGVSILRWAALVWAATLTAINIGRIDHPALAVAALVAMGGATVAAHLQVRRPADAARRVLGAEVVVAVFAVAADGWVRQGSITGQALAGTWPLAAILATATLFGPWWGATAGALLGGARVLAVLVAGVSPGQGGRAATATASTVLFWIVVGALCGAVVRVLRSSQDQLAEAEVRERMARDLHDGVLQTLALIERRSPTAEIARLAREQERDLREYLFGANRAGGDLGAELRAAAAKAERTWPHMSVTVTVTDDAPVLSPATVAAACGAAAEAMTNAGKHGQATRVVVFADIDESNGGLFLSVKDDGAGFEPGRVPEGVGIRESIRARIGGAGGAVVLTSAPGDGCEIRMTIPVTRKARAGG